MPTAFDVIAPTLADKLRFLTSAAAYGRTGTPVEVKETHMSFVFLVGDRVYKLKKPLRRPPLDLSTLAAREANCFEEVRLNRRLAPELYLGTVALTSDAVGTLALGGEGTIVDWLVVMRRLPEALMLDRLLACDGLAKAQVDELADLLAAFYRKADRVRLAPQTYIDRLVAEHDANCRVLNQNFAHYDRDRGVHVSQRIGRALQRNATLLSERAAEGALVEGHGDLRPEHICFNHPIVIFDCLEFSAELRTLDPFDELAYLALECVVIVGRQESSKPIAAAKTAGQAGHEPIIRSQDFAALLIKKVAQRLGQKPSPALLALYTALRAELRARLVLAHLLDPKPREPAKWAPLAALYLALAEDNLDCLDDV